MYIEFRKEKSPEDAKLIIAFEPFIIDIEARCNLHDEIRYDKYKKAPYHFSAHRLLLPRVKDNGIECSFADAHEQMKVIRNRLIAILNFLL